MKHLKQYWYPVRNLGGFKNANLDAAVNLEFVDSEHVTIACNATSLRDGCKVVLLKDEEAIFETIKIIDELFLISA